MKRNNHPHNKLIKIAVVILLFMSSAGFSLKAQQQASQLTDRENRANEIVRIKHNYTSMIYSEGNEGLIKLLTSIPKETILADQVVVELMQRYSRSNSFVQNIMNTIKPEGNWPDIAYTGQKLSGWEPMTHADRILDMTKAYQAKKSSFYHSKVLATSIHNAMNYWFDNKLVCKNWWYNDIGIPKTLGAAFILFEDQLSPTEKQRAIAVMSKAKIKMSGQNKVWLAGNVLVRGLLQNDFDLIKQARDSIFAQIVVSNGEGIQPDNSFHQHGWQQQFGNYGAAFISDMSFWSKVFNGTSLSAEQNKLNILFDLINEGYHRILWKGYMDVNGLGRQFYKQSQPHKAFSTGFSANGLRSVDAVNKDKYKAFLDDNFYSKDRSTKLIVLHHFWKSDQTVYRRPKWMTSVKMSSLRVIGSEAGNGDNMKGYYLADGATYTYINGDEYNNIFPVWDWSKLPGVTAYETNAALKVLGFNGYMNNHRFVGNVSDGKTGLTSMQLNRDKLSAAKSWIFTDDFVLCMGSGIATDSVCTVTTSIEQRLKKSDLLQFANLKWSKTEKRDLKNPKDVRFFHDNTGYIILQAEKLSVRDESRTGSWHDVMQSYPKDWTETNSVISLWVEHGVKPQDASYQYVILPASTLKKTASFDVKSIQVIMNTIEAQVVYLPNEKKVFIAAFSPIDIKLPLNVRFRSEQPGLFMVKYQSNNGPEVIGADPTQQLKFIDIEVNGSKRHLDLLR
jgi:chondroitin AC lyase